jgi:hypothetical protein
MAWARFRLVSAIGLWLLTLGARRVEAQILPFDHWVNRYWGMVQAGEGPVEDPLVWPASRQAVVAYLSRPDSRREAWAPAWVRELLSQELRRELAQKGGASWDRWVLGLMGWSGPRPVARSEEASYAAFGEGSVHFSPSARAYVRVRASHDPAALPSYTGIPRQKRRLGFNTAEADYAFGEWESSWILLRAGRFKQAWGPGDERSPWVSAWGPAYDGFYGVLRYHGFRFHFFSAFLETIPDTTGAEDVHRYLAGHFLTYSNGRNLSLGAGEISLYAGPNRPLSLAHLNPLMVHLEYEENHRTNIVRSRRNLDNWSLAFCGEWRPVGGWRLWGIWVIDDIQIDREKIPDATALRAGLSRRGGGRVPGLWELVYTRVGTWTYRHQSPYINWVSRGLPLGWDEGSDLQAVSVSWTGFPLRGVLAAAEVTYREQGELDIRRDLERRREFPWGWPFPSGVVERAWQAVLSVRYQPRYNVWVEGGVRWRSARNVDHIPGEERTTWDGFLTLAASVDFSVYGP